MCNTFTAKIPSLYVTIHQLTVNSDGLLSRAEAIGGHAVVGARVLAREVGDPQPGTGLVANPVLLNSLLRSAEHKIHI